MAITSSPQEEQPFDTNMLTPRSKIRALMAQIDNASDSEATDAERKSPLAPRKPHPTNSDGEDMSDVPMPRGRLAARLNAPPATVYTGRGTSKHTPESPASPEAANQQNSTQSGGQSAAPTRPEPGMRSVLFAKKLRRPVTSPRSPSSSEQSDIRQPEALQDGSYLSQHLSKRSASADSVELIGDSDSDTNPLSTVPRNERFLALVAKQRAARKAREAAEEKKRQEKLRDHEKRLQQSSDRLEEIMQEDQGADGEDADANRALSSQVKPTRKASKKALEAMNRETQRMSRNMQLAHAATVRKRFTVDELFQKFNFRRPGGEPAEKATEQPTSSSQPGSSRANTDIEDEHLTPPTSPASPEKLPEAGTSDVGARELPVHLTDEQHVDLDRVDEELPTVDDMLATAISVMGKDKESNRRDMSIELISKSTPVTQAEEFAVHSIQTTREANPQKFRVKLSSDALGHDTEFLDSDSDLEIAPLDPLRKRLERARDNVPVHNKASDRVLRLKALAHLTSPSKRDQRYSKLSVPAGQMMADLRIQARRQAALQRAERLDELRAKGVIIPTAEEREQEQMFTEDLLEKARQEVQELTRKEREERKKETPDGDNNQSAELDDSDDESYRISSDDERANDDDGDSDDENENEINISGSEDEADRTEADTEPKQLIEDKASEATEEERLEDEESSAGISATGLGTDAKTDTVSRPRRGRVMRIIEDDDEDREAYIEPQNTSSAVEPISPAIINPFAKAKSANLFGIAPMGLSQAFAATMEDSQVDDDDDGEFSSAMPIQMPEPNLPIHGQDRPTHDDPTAIPVPGTQASLVVATQENTQHDDLHDSTQLSEMPEPTQDAGIISTSPLARRFASLPPSTVETVLLADVSYNVAQSPRKKGRLVRRVVASQSSETESSDADAPSAVPLTNKSSVQTAYDAFTTLQKGERRRARLEAFDKNRSNAKEMIQEQAEESEDEYAGLGGASDDNSDSEMDEETKKMMDDGQVDLNESQLAAFHANKERLADEKAVEKLYKDINTGMLRRKRGGAAGFDDLSDSDEEIERRRRIRRAENARMRKALLSDENVGKIAENPKKAAFLKAIEDCEDRLEFEFLDSVEVLPGLPREDSIQEIPNSQPDTEEIAESGKSPGQKRKRPLEEKDPNARPPPAARRTKGFVNRKPSSLAEIRESLSYLIEEPHRQSEIQVAATQSSDIEEDQHSSRFASRRQFRSIVDRLSLRRAESADVAAIKGQEKSAFHRARKETDSSFSVPNLRKFHTVESASSEVSYATERTAGGSNRGTGDQVRRGGTKKSSVAFYAREAERRIAVDRVEKRRDLERKRLTEGRRGVLKGLGRALFE